MEGIKSIVKKELTRIFTDRRILISFFILPGALMLVLYSIMGKLITKMAEDIDAHIPTVYIQNAPEDLSNIIDTVNFDADITYIKSTDKTDYITDGILNGDIDLLVVFDEGFRETIRNYSKAGDPIPEVKTFYNPSEDYSSAARNNFISTVLNTYQQVILSERLGNIEQLQVFYIDRNPDASEIVNKDKAGGKYLAGLFPFLINVLLFQGAMSLGMDSITGEKERGTLASMLLSPIKRSEIVYGKLISLGILTSLAAVIHTIFIVIGMKNLYGDAMSGMDGLKFSPVEIIQLLLLLIITVYLFVSLVAFVSVHARTQKEAGTYVLPLYIVVMLGSVLTMFSTGGGKELYYYVIPIYNGSITIQNLLAGELTMAQFGLTIGSLALIAIVITTLITKAFKSEKVMFNA